MAVFTLVEARIMHDGRTIRFRFECIPAPASHRVPDWVPGAASGVTPTISGGRSLSQIGVRSQDWNLPKPGADLTTGVAVLATGEYYFRLAFADSGGVERYLSRHIGFDGSIPATGGTLGVKVSSTAAAGKVNIRFPMNVPQGMTGRIYMSPNHGILSSCRLLASGIPENSSTYEVISPTFEDASKAPDAMVAWVCEWKIDDPAKVVVMGEVVTASCAAGLFQDFASDGTPLNSTGSFSGFTVTNESVVGSDGFTADFQKGTGGVDLYVAPAPIGSDAAGVTGQDINAPLATISRAWALVASGKGSHINLLEGAVHPIPARIGTYKSGQDMTHPLVIQPYWQSYGGASRPALANRRPNIQDTSGTGCFRWTGAYPTTMDFVVWRKLKFNSTATYPSEAPLGWTAGGTHLVVDDCYIDGFNTGVNFFGGQGIPLGTTSVLRTIIVNSRGLGTAHSEAIFAWHVHSLLSSQCTFDFDGYASAGRDGLSHCFYMQVGTEPIALHSAYIIKSGSHGFQFRGGGSVAFCLLSGNPVAGYSAGTGGSVRCNVVEKGEDTDGPRGQGFSVNNATAQTCYASIIEDNIMVNSSGGQPQSITINWDQTYPTLGVEKPVHGLARNNTCVGYGPIWFDENDCQDMVIRNNIFLPTGTTAPAYYLYRNKTATTGFSWLHSDANVAVPGSSAPADSQCLLGNRVATFAAWKAATGTDATSIGTLPTFPDSTYDMGDWYAANGGANDPDAFRAFLKARPPGVWAPIYDAQNAYAAYQAAYRPIGLPSLGTGPRDYYGATDYRTAVAATGIALSVPPTGVVGTPSVCTVSVFPVGATLASPVTVTTAVTGAGMVGAPVVLSTSVQSGTFTVSDAVAQSISVSVTNDGGLSNPTPKVIAFSFSSAATGLSLSGPSSSTVGTPATFTVSLSPVDSKVSVPVTVTPHVTGSATVGAPVVLTTATPSATFAVNDASAETSNVSVTNNGGLANPHPASLTFTPPDAVSTNRFLCLTTSAGVIAISVPTD